MAIINFVRAFACHQRRHLRLASSSEGLPAASVPATASSSAATIIVHCQRLAPGREDWDRGLYRTTLEQDYRARIRRAADGAIDLQGLPCGRLRLSPAKLTDALKVGLQLTIHDLELTISAIDLQAALSTRSNSNIVTFSRRDR